MQPGLTLRVLKLLLLLLCLLPPLPLLLLLLLLHLLLLRSSSHKLSSPRPLYNGNSSTRWHCRLLRSMHQL